MGGVVIFGAGGRAGRRAVAEAVGRGHQVTAVVRDPVKHVGLVPEGGGSVVSGDVTDAASVARLAAGQDAAITTAVRLDVPAVEFYRSATRALVDGLGRAGVPRLALVGIGTVLEVAPGVPLHDTPGFPAEYRDFSLGHVAQLEVLSAASGLDWVVLAPPPVVLDDAAARTGRYRTGGASVLTPAEGADGEAEAFSYADLAVALLDEIDSPRHHRALIAVGP
jgi:putative NADH-flavin reductase